MDTDQAAGPERLWRVFYTAPRAEKKCESELEERRLEVFLPKRVVIRQWKDRKKKVVEPLFPSYIFAYVDERERLRVLQAPGIVRCLSFGGRLAEVTQEEIEQLKITQRQPERLGLAASYMPRQGEQVAIVEGPLKGLRGEVVEQRGQFHLIIAIPAIRQALSVNIPADWVRSTSRG